MGTQRFIISSAEPSCTAETQSVWSPISADSNFAVNDKAAPSSTFCEKVCDAQTPLWEQHQTAITKFSLHYTPRMCSVEKGCISQWLPSLSSVESLSQHC